MHERLDFESHLLIRDDSYSQFLHQYVDFESSRSTIIQSRWFIQVEMISFILSVHLSTVWVRSQSTSSEHALNTIVVSWKRYDLLKLVRTEDLLIRVLFRVQWVVLRDHVLSTWFRSMPESMNRHWHLSKKNDKTVKTVSIAWIFDSLPVSSIDCLVVTVTDFDLVSFINADWQLSMNQSFLRSLGHQRFWSSRVLIIRVLCRIIRDFDHPGALPYVRLIQWFSTQWYSYQ
jgi:hypothetical protein